MPDIPPFLVISPINDEFLDEFSNSMSERQMTFEIKLKNGLDELELNQKHLLTLKADIDEHAVNGTQKPPIHGWGDTSLIYALEAQIESLKGKIKCQDLKIGILEHQLETYEMTRPLSEIAEELKDATMDAQERMIEYQTTKVDKYKKGPKQKSADSQQKWALANEYLKEEILVHKTLKAARSAAAKRAGIVVEERQLTKMMPAPR
jgi:hypothetical protein